MSQGRTCILVDDIVDSGGTLVNAADALLEQGATAVYAYITHGVLSGGAVARITASKLKELVITDSIQPTEAVRVARNIRVLPIATLIGEAIAPHRVGRVGVEPVRLRIAALRGGSRTVTVDDATRRRSTARTTIRCSHRPIQATPQ